MAMRLAAAAVVVLATMLAPGYAADLIRIQPIVVCDNSGANCAGRYLDQYLAEANRIFSDNGTGVQFAYVSTPDNQPDIRYLNSTQYLNTSMELVAANQLVDPVHDLMRLPGHGQSPYPEVLNAWFVDSLTATTNGANPRNVFGAALINGNGLVIPTATVTVNDVAMVAGPDTLAHELAHNLGLPDLATSPGNLMQSAGRTGTLLTDAQKTTLQTPLIFTSMPKVSVDSTAMSFGSIFSTEIASGTPLDVGLTTIKIRFKSSDPLVASVSGDQCVHHNPEGFGCLTWTTVAVSTASFDGFQEVTIGFGNPLLEYVGCDLYCAEIRVRPRDLNLGDPFPYCDSHDCSPDPYSTAFVFTNGVTSRAGVSQTGSFESDEALQFFWSPPETLAEGPSILPSGMEVLMSDESEALGTAPSAFDSIQLPFAQFEATSVPEPASAALLALATATLAPVRLSAWRRRLSNRRVQSRTSSVCL